MNLKSYQQKWETNENKRQIYIYHITEGRMKVFNKSTKNKNKYMNESMKTKERWKKTFEK